MLRHIFISPVKTMTRAKKKRNMQVHITKKYSEKFFPTFLKVYDTRIWKSPSQQKLPFKKAFFFLLRIYENVFFYSAGDGQDYLNLALQDGGIILTMSLGTGKLEMNIKPNRVRFDDNQWHKLTVHRKVQEVRSHFILYKSLPG